MSLYHAFGIANERLTRTGAGDVVLQLKSALRDGVMSPLEFMQRLAALVPRPRLHLIRFHGVLAPHAKLRAAVGPGVAGKPSEPADEEAHNRKTATTRSVRCPRNDPARSSPHWLGRNLLRADMIE